MNTSMPPVPGSMPSLTPQMAAAPAAGTPAPRSLADLMSDGFYLLLLVKRGQLPSSAEAFVQAVQRFLDGVERGAVKMGIASEDVYAAKYAFCAAMDEAILSQPSPLRDDWELQPLQLRLFGDHLAGEHFFDRLEELRAQGAPRLPSLEVYHYCLLLGFEGKYRLEGPEKLGYLTARLGTPRKIVVGHASEAGVREQVGTWARAATAWADIYGMALVRFGDNMRNVAVTEGDKTEAEVIFGPSVNTWSVNDLVDAVVAARAKAS